MRTWLPLIAVLLVVGLTNAFAEVNFEDKLTNMVLHSGWGMINFMAAYPSEFRWFPLTGIYWGFLAAQLYWIGVYAAFSPQSWQTRLFVSWAVFIVLFSSWAAGFRQDFQTSLIPEAWDIIPPILAVGTAFAVVLLVACAVPLMMLARQLKINFASRDQLELVFRRRSIVWPVLEFAVMGGVSLWLAANYLTPLEVTDDRLKENLPEIVTFGLPVMVLVAAPFSIVAIILVLKLYIEAGQRRTAWRPFLFASLVAVVPIVGYLGSLWPTSFYYTLGMSAAAAGGSFLLTTVAGFLIASFAGWELQWDRSCEGAVIEIPFPWQKRSQATD